MAPLLVHSSTAQVSSPRTGVICSIWFFSFLSFFSRHTSVLALSISPITSHRHSARALLVSGVLVPAWFLLLLASLSLLCLSVSCTLRSCTLLFFFRPVLSSLPRTLIITLFFCFNGKGGHLLSCSCSLFLFFLFLCLLPCPSLLALAPSRPRSCARCCPAGTFLSRTVVCES